MNEEYQSGAKYPFHVNGRSTVALVKKSLMLEARVSGNLESIVNGVIF
jgi:hypothetical protein